MAELRQLLCCGLNEIHGISHITSNAQADEAFEVLFRAYFPKTPPRAFLLFTAARSGPDYTAKYGGLFKARIEELGIGTVTESDWTLNPNSSNQIKLYTWRINHAGLAAWMKKRFDPKAAPLINVSLTPAAVNTAPGNASNAVAASIHNIP